MIVLFHVTADTRWSDLPLSGASSRCSSASSALAGTHRDADDAADAQAAREVVPPTRVLDGFGAFGAAARDRAAGAGRLHLRAPPPIIRPASTARRKDCSP